LIDKNENKQKITKKSLLNEVFIFKLTNWTSIKPRETKLAPAMERNIIVKFHQSKDEQNQFC